MSVVFPVLDDVRWRQHDASAGQTTFPINYAFQDDADITVQKIAVDGTITTLVYPDDYALTGAGNPAGGNYTLVVPAIAGEKYRSIGTAVGARTTSIVRAGRYASAATDEDLDRALIRDLEQRRDLGRALKLDYGATLAEDHFPIMGADGLVKDGGSAADIQDAQGYAAQTAADRVQTGLDRAAAAGYAAAAATYDPTFRFKTASDLIASNRAAGGAGTRWQADSYLYDEVEADGDIVNAAGVPLYLRRNPDLVVYSEQAGVTDAVTNAAVINAMMAAALRAGAQVLKMKKGEWAANGQLIWPAGLKEIDWQDSIVTQLSNVGASQFALKYADALVALPALASNIDRTTDSVPFVSAHGLQVGDVIGYRNTAASSLNSWRSTYYDGQANIVKEVVDSTHVKLWNMVDPRGASQVFPAATTEVFLYPRTSQRLGLRNLNILGNSTVFGMVRLEGMSNFEIENVKALGGSYGSFSLGLAAFGRTEGLVAGEFGPATGQQYGLIHDAVHGHKSFGTAAYGTRHAIQHGNNDGLGAIPTRSCEHYGVTLGSHDQPALDFAHGNILDCRVVGGTVQGVGLAGGGNSVDVDVITSPLGYLRGNYVVGSGEIHDLNLSLRARRVVVSGDGDSTGAGADAGDGIVGTGGTSSTLAANTVSGGTLNIEIGEIDARRWSRAGSPIARFRNRGFNGRWGVRLRIDRLVCPIEPSQWFLADTVSGSNPILIDAPIPPDRFDPSVSPTHGWNNATRGIGTWAVASGGIVNLPVLVATVSDAGASIAAGTGRSITLTGFSGLTFRDSVAWGCSASLGASFAVSARIGSSGSVVIYVANVSSGSLSLPALDWTAYVTKRP